MPTKTIRTACKQLGIDSQSWLKKGLHWFEECPDLVVAGKDCYGRNMMLESRTYTAWLAMREAASSQHISLLPVSGYRSYAYQSGLIKGKRQNDIPLDDILKVNTPPGFSEHHSGRAMDLGTDGCTALEETFENTEAYDWLEQNARQYGFAISYPRGNRHGICYEPWHWCYHQSSETTG